MLRLLGIGRERPAVGDVAERAAPRAEVPEDHEGRGALAEALSDIGAGRLLANRVEIVLAEDLLDCVETRAGRGRAHPNPFGFRKPFLRHDRDRDARLRRASFLFSRRRHFSMSSTIRSASARPSSSVPAATPSAEAWVTSRP